MKRIHRLRFKRLWVSDRHIPAGRNCICGINCRPSRIAVLNKRPSHRNTIYPFLSIKRMRGGPEPGLNKIQVAAFCEHSIIAVVNKVKSLENGGHRQGSTSSEHTGITIHLQGRCGKRRCRPQGCAPPEHASIAFLSKFRGRQFRCCH